MNWVQEEEEEEEEEQRLIKVVEYVEPLMANELLCKFPDNSVFDFDYSQSSIWSPLLPRAYNSKPISFLGMSINMSMEMEITPTPPPSKKMKILSHGLGLINRSALKRLTANIKKNINLNLLKNMKKKKKKKKQKDFDFDFDFSPNPTSTKGWRKVLKASSKNFKKKNKDSTVNHVKLSNYLRDPNL